MSTVHPAAAAGFTAGAVAYAEGRPEYPAEIEAWLHEDLGLSAGKTAMDLGAGTGKFSRSLLATGAAVIAVEPVQAMLEQLRQRYPRMDAMNGSAEAIPLADASVDAVVCAQSFHWFATREALREIHRVLKPGGSLGLVWNVRDESVPWVARLSRLMAPFEGDVPRFQSYEWRRVFPAEGFGPLSEKCFENRHTGSPERVIIDRILSVSFMAALPRDQQEQVRAQMWEIIYRSKELAGQDEVTFPYRTMAFACTKML